VYGIRQQFAVSKEPKEQPSAINISVVTVAPIMAVLVAGYVIGTVRVNTLKCWPRGSVRRRRKNEN